jgi:hypothetical protein
MLQLKPALRCIASPEAELRSLFAQEDDLLSKLSEIREQQKQARVRYAASHDLLMLPGMGKLREVLG